VTEEELRKHLRSSSLSLSLSPFFPLFQAQVSEMAVAVAAAVVLRLLFLFSVIVCCTNGDLTTLETERLSLLSPSPSLAPPAAPTTPTASAIPSLPSVVSVSPLLAPAPVPVLSPSLSPAPAPAPSAPLFPPCKGIDLLYQVSAVQKIFPYLNGTPQLQPYSFAATATITNMGFSEVQNWAMGIHFQHNEVT
jgi:hypothetical protein